MRVKELIEKLNVLDNKNLKFETDLPALSINGILSQYTSDIEDILIEEIGDNYILKIKSEITW